MCNVQLQGTSQVFSGWVPSYSYHSLAFHPVAPAHDTASFVCRVGRVRLDAVQIVTVDWAGVNVGAEAAELDSRGLPWDILLHLLHSRHMCGEHKSSALKVQMFTSYESLASGNHHAFQV